MGAAVYIELEREIEGFDPFIDGKSLAPVLGELGAICEELGIPSMEDFVVISRDHMADFFESEGLEELVPELDKAKERWFDPPEGRLLLDRLIERLANPTEIDRHAVPDVDAVLRDLRDAIRVLERAESAGVRWRFSVDY